MPKPMLDRQDMIRFLGDVIEGEMEKPEDKIDMDLIAECESYLAELLCDIAISDEQMQQNIAKIKGKASRTAITSVRICWIPHMRRIVAAVCAAVLLIGGSITAYAFVPAFRDIVHSILSLGKGSSIETSGVTFRYLGKTATYQTIDELIQNEGLDILYPHELPEELKIKSITGSGEDTDLVYSIAFFDGITGIDISYGEGDVSSLSNKSEIFVSSKNITSYILTKDNTVISTTVYNGWTYYITTNTMDDMKTILENLY